VINPFLLLAVERLLLPRGGQVGLRGQSIGAAPTGQQSWLVARVVQGHPLEPDAVRFVGMGHRRRRDGQPGEYFFTVRGAVPSTGHLAVWQEGVAMATAALRLLRSSRQFFREPCAVKILGPKLSHLGMLCPEGATYTLLVPGCDDQSLQTIIARTNQMVTRGGDVLLANDFERLDRPAPRYDFQNKLGVASSWRAEPGSRPIRRTFDAPTVHL